MKYFRCLPGTDCFWLVSYPLIYLFEKTFGFICDATLIGTIRYQSTLLRKLAELAPGTFQHSLQVANLLRMLCLILAVILYWKGRSAIIMIGKMDMQYTLLRTRPRTWIRTIILEFEQSARIIIDHVRKGVELPRKNKSPTGRWFYPYSHGTSTVHYFYRSYISKYPEAEWMWRIFKYPWSQTISKETAIVMMADSLKLPPGFWKP